MLVCYRTITTTTIRSPLGLVIPHGEFNFYHPTGKNHGKEGEKHGKNRRENVKFWIFAKILIFGTKLFSPWGKIIFYHPGKNHGFYHGINHYGENCPTLITITNSSDT